jgi:hypothetical protein
VETAAGKQLFKIVVDPASDTLNDLFAAIKSTEGVKIMQYKSAAKTKGSN